MRRTLFLPVLLLFAVQALALPQTTQIMAIRDGVDQAVLKSDGDALADFATQLAAQDGDWATYYRAYANFRKAQIEGTSNRDARDLLNVCIETLRELLKQKPDMGEAHLLQAACYGASASFYMIRAAGRGRAAEKALDQASILMPGNPRVLLQRAKSYIRRPGIFGGDKDKGMELLQLAVAAFPNWSSPEPEAPVWGVEEAWLYIGRLHSRRGNTEQAREAFATALELAPDFKAAKNELDALG